jgi:hypothetical protein
VDSASEPGGSEVGVGAVVSGLVVGGPDVAEGEGASVVGAGDVGVVGVVGVDGVDELRSVELVSLGSADGVGELSPATEAGTGRTSR